MKTLQTLIFLFLVAPNYLMAQKTPDEIKQILEGRWILNGYSVTAIVGADSIPPSIFDKEPIGYKDSLLTFMY